MRIIFSLIFFTLLMNAENQKGYGWDICNGSLNIGGYLDMTYDDKRSDKFLFNDIAIIVSGSRDRFDLLAEIELSHISLEGKSNQSSDVDLNVERLQLSYALSDEQMLRVGRFNSDIGYWNQAPILILQDTITKPYIVGKLFPQATTGVLFRKNLNENNSLSLTYQNNADLAHQDNSVEVDKHSAFAYLGESEDASWRLSVGKYRDTQNRTFNYLGVGADYELSAFTLQSELFFQKSKESNEKPYSGYLQSTWHFKEKQDVVFRLEGYDDKINGVEEKIYLLGYVYRPSNNTALKVEYLNHTELPLNRFVYSLSVLF